MLRSEGTVAVGPDGAELEPHAATRIAKTPELAARVRRLNRANLIWTSCPRTDAVEPCCLLPDKTGRECAGSRPTQSPCASGSSVRARLSIAQAVEFVKVAIVQATKFVRALDKSPWPGMIPTEGVQDG